MPASTVGYIAILSQVGVDQLRKAGMDVDLQLMDFATLLRRIASQAPPDKGGWNVTSTSSIAYTISIRQAT
jgi:peptide/nickel transport system substrate-binding protein